MQLSITKTIKESVRAEGSVLRSILASAAILAVTMGTLAWVSGADAAQSNTRQTAAVQPLVNAATAKQSTASATAAQGETYDGMITDTHCGARHSAAIGLSAADCTRACVHGGNSFALVDGDAVYLLDGDVAALKQMAGQRVHVTGTLSGNKISVSAVAMGE